ncbi:MAG: DNA polymerase I [Parcubacteria bacterium C7867-005]|nr:MAG: DNA polymerase I [Parcubacteria bacterium C7867-005]
MKTKKNLSKRLVLLDAHAIIHRAYHALPEFATSSGEPTGALYGVVTMLIKIIEELKPSYIVACFDLPDKTHRHEAYEGYKGTRKKVDDNLILQLERSKDIFSAWGIPIYSMPGFEADDILGTIVEKLKNAKDIEIIIASGDMDTLQLVQGKQVQVYTLKKGIRDTILYDEKAVLSRFGFPPSLLPDFKGLRGDPSDNIIGVKGIGEKTATSLITTFGTVEKIYKALKKGKEEYSKAGITDRIAELLVANEEEALFSKTLATIRIDAPIDFKLPKEWKEDLVIDNLLELFRQLEFRTLGERIKMLVSGIDKTERGEVDPKKQTKEKEKTLPKSELEKKLALALWVIDSNITSPTVEDILAFTKQKSLEEADKIIEEELDKRKVRSVFEEIEMPITPVIEQMNKTGVKVDKAVLKDLSKTYHEELSKLEKKIWDLAGENFNINSPKQMGEILFGKLGLAEKRQKKTASGTFSTKESELEKIKDKHDIIVPILNYRELQKLLSTYIDAIPPQLDLNSRLHSTFDQAGATTGRMSSNNPNLQNIPIKSSLGQAIRHAFIAEDGFKLVALDYSQIELRIAAILSGDKKLVDIFKKGEDVHTGVASRVFKVDPASVDKEMRRKAKIINFGILYGMGVNALKTNLGTDRKEAQEFYNNYFETFSGLASYLDSVKADAERKGYTETMFGRRRYFAGFKSPLPFIRASAERMAINAPIQGTQADFTKISMQRIDQYIRDRKQEGDIRLILQVHDELIYEIREDLVEGVVRDIKPIMENVLSEDKKQGVPIIVSANVGDNWGEMKTL